MSPTLRPANSTGVAVIIAAFNAESTIARAVRSALAEPDVAEVWVIDDVSTDETVARAAAADDGAGRLKILRQDVNAGPAAARNRALAESRQPWVCVLDSDDYFLPGRIGRLLQYSRGVEMVADHLLRVGEDEPEPTLSTQGADGVIVEIDLAGFVNGNISRRGQYRQELGFIKPLMDRAFMAAHGLDYETRLRLGEDYHLYARILAAGGRLRLVPPQGYVAVTRAESLSGRHTIEDLQALRDSDLDISQAPGITPEAQGALRRHYHGIDQRLQWRRMIEAVKARDLPTVVSTFTSPQVGVYLFARLLEQGWVRTVGRARGNSA